MRPSRPSAIELFKAGDIPGLIEALDVEDVADRRANDARVALSLIGAAAIPLLLPEIGKHGGYRTLTSLKCQRARIAMAGIGQPAIPHLMDAIRYGDARLAEGAEECLEAIEEGGVVLPDTGAPTKPIPISYPDDVLAAFECKLGRPLAARSLWQTDAGRKAI
jgi:hypothetical protein